MSEPELRAAVIRSTDVNPEPRTSRAIAVLLEIGYKVDLINWSRESTWNIYPDESFARKDFKLRASYGVGTHNLLGQFRWQIWIIRKLMKGDYQLIYACDADTALTALIISKIKKCHLVYDQFDPISSRTGVKWIKTIGDKLEKFLSKNASFSIVASEARLARLNQDQIVISNYPRSSLKVNSRIKREKLQIAYVGVLQQDRGLMELTDCVKALPEIDLTVAGYGALSEFILKISSPNIIFKGKVSHEEAMDLLANSDVSYAMYDPTRTHNQMTASSKLFESALSGTPCIVSEGTQTAVLVEQYKLGWVIPYADGGKLLELLQALAKTDDKLIENFDANSERFLQSFDWKFEERILVERLKSLDRMK